MVVPVGGEHHRPASQRLAAFGGKLRTRLAAGAVLLAVAAAAATVAALGDDASSGATSQRPLTIGALFSLTGGGNVYGTQQVKAAELAVSQINQQGGVNGVPLKLIVRDDHSDPAVGKAAMRKLIQGSGVVAVLGPSLSLVAVAADPVADSLKTPVLAVSNTADGIVGKCAYPCTYVWRDSLGESLAVPANITAYVQEVHPSRVAIVFVGGDVLGIDEAKIAAASFKQNRVKISGQIAVPSTGSVVAGVKRALKTKPDVIFIGATFGQVAADVMKEARAEGFTGAFLGGNTMNSSSTTQLAGTAGTGARSASAWYAGNDFPANTDFKTAYNQVYGEAPDQFAAQSYIGVQILASAFGKNKNIAAKPVATQRQVLQGLLPRVALTTPLGPFRFTADHDVNQIIWILAMDGRGGHSLTGFCNPLC
jgi:branched-chain amino acid transport system substrate-binding protein